MALRPADFESAAYTSSATWAGCRYWRVAARRQRRHYRGIPCGCEAPSLSRLTTRILPTFPMTAVRNVLFVMCDQLRRDFVSCYGESPVETPNIDRLAARGVRFDNAFVQAGVCGPARMSFYTGRYVNSHGATWNRVPLSASERTLGDYLARGRAHGGARRQDARAAGHCRAEALRHRDRIGARRAAARRRLSRRRSLTTATRRRARNRATPSGCARAVTTAPIRGPISSSAPSTVVTSSPAGTCATRTCRRGSRRAHSETAYMTDLALDWIRARGRDPLGAAPLLCEAALAVSCAGAVPQAVPPQGHRPDSARAAGRHRRRASRCARLSRARRMQ